MQLQSASRCMVHCKTTVQAAAAAAAAAAVAAACTHQYHELLLASLQMIFIIAKRASEVLHCVAGGLDLHKLCPIPAC